MRNRPLHIHWIANGWLVLCACLLMSYGHAQQVLELRPNIKALPPSDITIGTSIFGNVELRFSATTWNSGLGPLELRAGETGQGQQNVYQRVYLDDGNYYDHLAGTFEWHPSHNHFHFENYALYTLQSVKGKSKRSSYKTTFCLMDNLPIDTTLPGAPAAAVYGGCNPDVQGMSVGWGDVYVYSLPDQEIDLSRLKDGDYRLYIEADPKNLLLEDNENDNVACALLHISVTSQTVDVLNPDSCDTSGGSDSGGDVTVTGIVPDTAPVGKLVEVTISGTGFTPGMDVTFENGSGPQPSASGVTVVDSSTITAIVTVKNRGGKYPDYIWDVRVGSGVLVDGFIVTP